MAIRIIRSDDTITVDFVVGCLYALPGIGKTTLGQTADKPLTLDFDMGIHRAPNRKDSVRVTSWKDVEDMTREDLEPFNTLVVDTVGRCIDAMSASVIEDNPKRGAGGSLDLKGWGIVKGRFITWLNLMRSYGKDVILLSHMDEKQEGEIVRERLDVQGGSKAEIYKVADFMGKLYIDGKERKLDMSPREGSLGKNPAQLDVLVVPGFQKAPRYLADLLAQIKGKINERSADATAKQKLIDAARLRFETLDNMDAFNALVPELRDAIPEIKVVFNLEAEKHGLKFVKSAGKFVEEAD